MSPQDDPEPAWAAALLARMAPPAHGPLRALTDEDAVALAAAVAAQCRACAVAHVEQIPWCPFQTANTWRLVVCGARGAFTIHAFVFIQPGGEA